MAVDPKRFTNLAKLGDGTYGDVYKAVEIQTGQVVALKISKINQEEYGVPVTTMREISTLRSVHHPNIMALKSISIFKGQLTLVEEYLEFDLYKFMLLFKRPLEIRLICSYAFQILCGLYELHSHSIIHRDIKPSNLLLDREGIIKLCDFGLARFASVPVRPFTPNVVTRWYRAPELLCGSQDYDCSIDIWSIGCILAEMVCAKPLFPGDSDVDMIHKIFGVLGTPKPDEISGYSHLEQQFGSVPQYDAKDLQEILQCSNLNLVDLIKKMLTYDPKKRITASEALYHPFFDDIPSSIFDMSWPKSLPVDDD